MIIITGKKTNVIRAIADETYNGEDNLGQLTNGYPVIRSINVSWATDTINIYRDVNVPEPVVAMNYCYTEENEFYENPNYVEPNNPYGISNDLYDTIRDEAIMQVESEVTGNADE